MSTLTRARPLLGTLVEVRVEGLGETQARAALDAAFAEVATVHARMSFHDAASDLSRLHVAEVGASVRVDFRTRDVLACALHIAALSGGCFDPTIAARQVVLGALLRPAFGRAPDENATWRDIELLDDDRVRLRRPLWIDLGGIAKGYAVDRAIEVLVQAGASHAVVNAGGDMRVAGQREETVYLRGAARGGAAGAVSITDAALASSTGAVARMRSGRRWVGAHIDGRSKMPIATFSSASVIAPACMVADALTKVVLAASPSVSRRALAACAAQAAMHSTRYGWRSVGAAA